MIMPSDDDYKATKLIMLGKASMKLEFKPLAEWIVKTYGVKPINIIYDTMESDNSPRLQICFEFSNEKEKFYENSSVMSNFDQSKQLTISAQFKNTLTEQGLIRKNVFSNLFNKDAYKTDGLWVYYSAFAPIAKEEVNGKIPKENIAKLNKEIDDEHLWQIVSVFAGVVFFLYTDEQVKRYENNIKKEWSKKYFDILKEYDEFDYFKENEFSISLDSKENFDKKYDSSWYNYFH